MLFYIGISRIIRFLIIIFALLLSISDSEVFAIDGINQRLLPENLIEGVIIPPKLDKGAFNAKCELVYPSTIVTVDVNIVNQDGESAEIATEGSLRKKCLSCENMGKECWVLNMEGTRADPHLGTACITPGDGIEEIEKVLIGAMCPGSVERPFGALPFGDGRPLYCVPSEKERATPTYERIHRVTKILACVSGGNNLKPSDLYLEYEHCGQHGELCCKTGDPSQRCVPAPDMVARSPADRSDPCKCINRNAR